MIFIYVIVALYVTGFILAIGSTFQARSPQGTTAWLLGLIFFPFLAIPIFLLFGKKRLDDYALIEEKVSSLRTQFQEQLRAYKDLEHFTELEAFLTTTEAGFLKGNKVELLLNGRQTFDEMLSSIRDAKSYICLQTFIFRTDGIGKQFIEALKLKSLEGVKVYLLYENFGVKVDEDLILSMKDAGVQVGEFPPVRKYKLQLNFRNHRKLLIVDGHLGIYGGINIGDDYLGLYPDIGFWRDTNIKVQGPVVIQSQIDFIKDWYWCRNCLPEILWGNPQTYGSSNALAITSGPADDRHFNLLQHIEIINSSKQRLWIANPYFVPPQALVDAILIARMRGVDVRLIVPSKEKCDNKIVSTAADVYLAKLARTGIRVYKYKKGMMHQKVILVDDCMGIIGSSNLDFRSMYINFENSIASNEKLFLQDLVKSFEEDFKDSVEKSYDDFRKLPLSDQLASRLANCLAPIL